MELQASADALEQQGIRLVAVSYDPVATLERFARERGVHFPLLSDPDSATIRAYGVLNEEAKGRFAGIPHPGFFLIDAEGVIRARLAHEGYKRRHGASELIEAVQALREAGD